MIFKDKPLGHKAYGSIPHLPGSRRGPKDHGMSTEQANLLIKKTRDKHDVITVSEKLDGSCCVITKINDEIIPLGRAGYRAISSPFEQHKMFHNWVFKNYDRFNTLLKNGERCAGEWLAQAHGTRYELKHEPYVIFDIFRENSRISINELYNRCGELNLINPRLLHSGPAISIEDILNLILDSGHGAIDPVEGAVWRMERSGIFNFMGKYVRKDKIDGCFLPENTGKDPVWNWRDN